MSSTARTASNSSVKSLKEFLASETLHGLAKRHDAWAAVSAIGFALIFVICAPAARQRRGFFSCRHCAPA